MADKIKILYLIQLPPPVHGVSIINEMVYTSDFINLNTNKALIRLNFSKKFEELRVFTFLKLFKTIKIGFQLFIKILFFKPNYIYFSIFPTGWGFFRDFLYVLIIKGFKITPIYHLHISGIGNCQNKIIKLIYRLTFNRSIIIHLSEGLLKTEILPLELNNSQFHIVPNAIKEVNYEKNLVLKDFISVLFVSNIFEEKGIFNLINIFSELKKKYNNIELVVLGPFKSLTIRRKLSSMIRELALTDCIFIKGPLYNDMLAKEYMNADIFLYPTYYDSFPLVLLEAMSFSLPIVTTETGAIPEFLTHGETALLSECNDVRDLIKQTSCLIENMELRKKLGEKAKMHFQNNFTKAHFEQNMGKVFSQLGTKG